MIFLHTSDWHLGHTLYNARRHEEFAAFFGWLLETMRARQVDALLVAGDVFDTGTPGPQAQKLYYDFLRRVRETGCRHVVITAGNHDSPSFLEAPAEVLQMLSVHVVGQARENPGDEVICLRAPDGRPEAFVCAIPFLRDRDVRRQEDGETPQDKERRLAQGISAHAGAVCAAALQMRQQTGLGVPVVAMAHLYISGAAPGARDDGSRPLYVGTLGEVPETIFPPELDYVALGHLHRAQKAGHDRIRYSGSVLPMSFSETQAKSCFLVSVSPQGTQVETIGIPVFRRLVQVRGSVAEIQDQLRHLQSEGKSVFVDVVHTGDAVSDDLRRQIQETLEPGRKEIIEILRFGSERRASQVIEPASLQETLEELDELEVFGRRLNGIVPPLSPEKREKLLQLYQETLAWMARSEAEPEKEA